MSSQIGPAVADTGRRESVLESALETFARYGYRKTSMEEVARTADISRPGLYFLFSSKEALFRAAVTQSLTRDIAAVEKTLADTERPLHGRVLQAFNEWAGRYIGPMSREITTVIENNPDLLGAIVETTPRRFEELLTDGIALETGRDTAASIAQTLISTSIGLKHQVEFREAYLRRLSAAIDHILP